MSDLLAALEGERSQTLRPISSLGDLRPGSICAVPRRCGKPTYHCAKPNPDSSPIAWQKPSPCGINIFATRCFSQGENGFCHDRLYPIQL